MTDEQREARRQGRLDQRCRSCGTTSAATSYCCHCHGHDLEYRIHLPSWSPKRRDLPRVVQWCEQDNTPRPPVNPDHPMSAKNRARRALRKDLQRLGAATG